jgi:hypothetical protein
MRILPSLFLGLAFFTSQAAMANPATNQLGECLKSSTNGKDRTDLARWIFISMSAHPEMNKLTTVTPTTRNDADRGMAQLVTRLLTENCTEQTRAVMQAEGSQGMLSAFRSLGEVAMMELMSNAEVSATISGYTKFLDQGKFEALLRK